MKNHKAIFVLQYILVLGLSRNAYAQRGNYNYKNVRRNKNDFPSGAAYSIGANHFFCDQSNFNTWINNEYHKSILQDPVGITLDKALIEKYFDLGYHLHSNYPYELLTFFGGANLCRRPHFRSFLNADIGFFEAEVKKITPPNYIPTPAQNGQDMFLLYQNGCVGFSLKNMFVSKPNKNHTSFISTIDIQFSSLPWHGTWEYGYQSGKYFYGTPVSGIPQLSNTYFSVTYSIGYLRGNYPNHHGRFK